MPSFDVAAALHANRHAEGGPDPVSPESIGAATPDDLSQGLAGKADKSHADSHAEGGSDPVSPESIGAIPSFVSTYSNTDLNTLIETGTYFAWTGNTNVPPTGQASGYLDVTANTALNVRQEWTSYNENSVSEIERWVRIMRGGVWTPWRAIGPVRGFSQPEGQRTAPAGTEYIDLNATAGASEWRKQSGSGSTGWIVTEGDTGWRDVVTTWAWPGANVTADVMHVRRVGNEVYLKLANFSCSGSSSVIDVRGDGFHPSPYTFVQATFNSGAGPRNNFNGGVIGTEAYLGDVCFLRVSPTVIEGGYAYLSWITDDPWPTTLPGTPA